MLTACGAASSSSSVSSETSAPVKLAGTAWLLSSFAGPQGALIPAVTTGDAATLNFGADGAITGSTGCNRIVGTYSQNGSSLAITLGPMTKRACTPAVTAQEAVVLAALPKVESFTAKSSLLLAGSDHTTLLNYDASPTGLGGTSWHATAINNGKGAVVSTAGTEKVTISFGDAEQVDGFGGCNTYRGSYTVSGTNQLTFGPISSTMMACDAELMQIEQEYQAALPKVTTYDREGSVLTLRDSTGAMQVVYAATP